MARVAFLGLGNMGRGMARRLIDAGHELHVWNRSPDKAEALVAAGARLAASPREAAAGADAVIAMVADDAASQAVWTGPDGALAAQTAPGAFAIDCSTLSHDWVMKLAGQAAAKGLRYIDCPVTGLPDAAAAGALTLLVGADEADLAAAGPFLAPMSQEMIRFGGIGAGTAYKLMINLMGAVQIAATGEGLLLAEKAGLDMAKVLYALERGQAASPQVVRNARRMAADHHETEILFSGRLRLKDVRCALAMADSLGQPARFGKVAEAALVRLLEQGYGELNESKVIEALRAKPGTDGLA